MDKIIRLISNYLNCLFNFYTYNLLFENFLIFNKHEKIYKFISINILSIFLTFVNIFEIPQLNIAFSFLLTLFYLIIFFKDKFKTKLLLSILATSFSASIKILISFIVYFIYQKEHTIISKSLADNIITNLMSQIIIYFLIQLVIHCFKSHKYYTKDTETLNLYILPITSILVIFELIYINKMKFFNLLICFGLALTNLFVFHCHLELISQVETLKNQQIEQAQHYKQVEKNIKSTHAIIHDFKDHLSILNKLCESNKEAVKYISELYDLVDQNINTKEYGISNHTLEIIIYEERKKCNNLGINFNLNLQYPNLLFLNHVDTCSIFANALNNAIEACSKVSSIKERYITLEIKKYQQMVFIYIENSNAMQILTNKNGQTLLSSKNDQIRHGYGLTNIKRAVKKYSGQISLDYSNTNFKLFITLPIKN